MEISGAQLSIMAMFLVNIILTAFYGGRLVERVEGHSERLKKLEEIKAHR